MSELWMAGIAVAVPGLLLWARSLIFRGRPTSHKRVYIMTFGNDDPHSGHGSWFDSESSEEWPSIIGDEAEPALSAIQSESEFIIR